MLKACRMPKGKYYEIYLLQSVVIMSTDASFEDVGVIAGEEGGCFRMPGFPTAFFSSISILINADDT